MATRFYDQEVKSKLVHKRTLSKFLDTIVRQHRPAIKGIGLTYIFVSDEALLGINQQFLNHNTYTDIITFDLSENEKTLLGEIYVSVDRILENAEKFKTTYQRELHRVIFHGALHLCGFKDKTVKDREAMRVQEDLCLETWYNRQ